ncbi:MAG: LamB/YcsF family protein [Candidatus Nephthysia bennettiae]|uniref:LamB/YcsF family protein n=1 Tax=Candidatus Nephthysia bennettiae TaxID=3127016 RepID=A0A934NBB2_9BACT|nr:LamB/YcsF family protein [Candidatus Dormibacteraeota bacterium]PZR94047.1 MAG: LamB/YcsF family protein [Candidatus Dormibacteraeota bacterium]
MSKRLSHVRLSVDLCCDVGEGFGAYVIADDERLLDVVTSANIACGFHAGDPRIIASTVASAARRGVSIGAHPGYPDLVGFGRRRIVMSTDEIATDLLYQLGALSAFVRRHDLTLQHITPHGSLGNTAAVDVDCARGVIEAVEAFDPDLTIVTGEGELARMARQGGFRVAVMFLADRAYTEELHPVSRSQPGAVLTQGDEVAERVVRAVTEGVVETVAGTDVPLRSDTVLIHSDTPSAAHLAARIRQALTEAGVAIEPMANVLR